MGVLNEKRCKGIWSAIDSVKINFASVDRWLKSNKN